MNHRGVTHKTFSLLFRASRPMFCLFLFFEVAFCLIPIACAKLIAQIVDLFADHSGGLSAQLATVALFYIALTIAIQVLSPIRSYVADRYADVVAKDSEVLLAKKLTLFFTVTCFEDHAFYNDMQLAKGGCGARLISQLQMISSILRGVITIATTAGLMLRIHWAIGLLALCALIPNAYYSFWAAKLAYFSHILGAPDFAKEVRLYRIGDYILNLYRGLFDAEYRRINKVRRRQCAIGLATGALAAIANGVGLYWFIALSVRGQASPGSIVLYISLLPQFISGLQMLINGYAQGRENNLYIQHFIDFLERDSGEANGTLGTGDEGLHQLAVTDLSFRYPGAQRNALMGVSFAVTSPTLVAVVGENGSGKSTLIKLLMRLFDATSGQITYNHRDIRDYQIESLRRRMSGVFQDPARFAFSLRENLRLGDIDAPTSQEALLAAARQADLTSLIESLPAGLDTLLEKQFEGGTELSGGQWQKVSLARAFYASADILFFDEASSDLDPAAEQAFYHNVRIAAANKIAFYITHRLSGTKDADLILVLQNGELVESGTHDGLMQRHGEYARLYTAQASGYDYAGVAT